MTEQEEKVAQQRLDMLTVFQGRLIELETDATLLYPVGHERHDRAQKDHDDLTEIVGRLETEPLVASLRLSNAESALTKALERLADATKAVTEAEAALAVLQPKVTP